MIYHLLSTANTFVWNTFFKNQEIWEEIKRNVKRTRTDIKYFQIAVDSSRNQSEEERKQLEKQTDTKKADMDASEKAK